MNDRIHFIVVRSRLGWAVNVDADRLSDHRRVESARQEAAQLAYEARQNGWEARFIDLSPDPRGDHRS